MIRKLAVTVSGLTLVLLAGSAQSSGCCDETPRWKLSNAIFTGYDSSIVAVPGNDTRVNLVLLTADRQAPMRLAPPAPGERPLDSGMLPFFNWGGFKASLQPAMPSGEDGREGSRCASNASGTKAFEAAITAQGGIADGERRGLIAQRRAMQPNCVNDASNASIDAATGVISDAARPFAAYLEGAQAFYVGNFDVATARFTALAAAKNAWLKETALYMVARTALNRAQSGAFTDYGSLEDPAKRDAAAAGVAGKAFDAYLRAYPSGTYAASARGLMRRVYWLAGDQRSLAAEYAKLFSIHDPARRGIDAFTLAEEIDQKLTAGPTDAITDTTLLAVADLARMRAAADRYSSAPNERTFALAELEAQRARFAADKPLFDYLLASHAFYVANRPAEVLRIIPDAARQARFGYTDFSRQMLRGFALEATRDRNARGFWIEMLGGATQPLQRQAVELALAMHEERNGGLARVFAANSPIRDPNIRGILLGYGAGPDILRQQASGGGLSKAERDAALFVLLTKQLGRGLYAGFLGDLRLVDRGARVASGDFNALNFRGATYGAVNPPPLGLFTAPGGSGDYGCPALREIAGALAKNPGAPKPLICVGEFMRVNGFDKFLLDITPPKDALGGAPSLFPGKPYSRLEAYKLVIADATAPANDKAYALYRAVNCYAPAGANDCGGIEVGRAQRQAWFQRLKRDYPQTQWAKSLNYYW